VRHEGDRDERASLDAGHGFSLVAQLSGMMK
jgi:hypothetical protein